jgi:hypothetical protein
VAAKGEEVEIKGWGVGAKFTGPQMTCVLVLILMGAFIGVLIYQHNAKADEGMASVARAQEAVRAELQQNREAQEAMIYVISLPQAEREKLNLSRPRKLTEMQR